jgi:hypothetical protein
VIFSLVRFVPFAHLVLFASAIGSSAAARSRADEKLGHE